MLKKSLSRAKSKGMLFSIALLASGSMISQVVTVSLTPFVTRLYSPEAFGEFALALAVAGPLVAVAGFRYHDALILPKSSNKARALFDLSLLITICLVSLLVSILVLGHFFVFNLFGHSSDELAFIFATGFVFLFSYRRLLETWLTRVQAYEAMAMVSIVIVIVDRCIAISWGYLGAGEPVGLMFGRTLGVAVGISILWLFVRQNQGGKVVASSPLLLCACASEFVDFAKYSWANLATQLTRDLPIIVVGFGFGAGVAGLFALAQRVLIEPAILFGDALSKVFYQKAARIYSDGGDISKLSLELVEYLLRWSLPPAILFSFVSSDLFAVVFGDEWRDAGIYAAILMPVFLSGFIVNPVCRLFDVLRMQKMWAWLVVVDLSCVFLVLGIGVYFDYVIVIFAGLSVVKMLISMYRIFWVMQKAKVSFAKIVLVFFKSLLAASLGAIPMAIAAVLGVAAIYNIIIFIVMLLMYYSYFVLRDERMKNALGRFLGRNAL